MNKVAVVTGCSSGIGYETALALAREGYTTYATMRDVSRGAKLLDAAAKEGLRVLVREIDVDSSDSVDAAMDEIISKEGRVDVLVNNAGYMIFGTLEDLTLEELRDQFETNFFGIVRMIQKTAPVMRRNGDGYIINMSSVAGRIGFPGTPAYISSKFALEGLSECLRYALGSFGIKVVLIEPGVVKTNLFNSMRMSASGPDSPYKELTESVAKAVKMMSEMGTPPSEVADAVLRAVGEEDPHPRYPVGNDAVMFLEARRSKSDMEFETYLKDELNPM